MEQVAKGLDSIPSSATFRAAAKVAAGEPPDDSFAVLPDVSVSTQGSSASGRALPRTLMALGQRGLVGIPATTWARPTVDADKENLHATGPQGGTPMRHPELSPIPTNVPLINVGATPRAALADITPLRAPFQAARTGQAVAAAAAAAPSLDTATEAATHVDIPETSTEENGNANLDEGLGEAVGESTAHSAVTGHSGLEQESTGEPDSLQ